MPSEKGSINRCHSFNDDIVKKNPKLKGMSVCAHTEYDDSQKNIRSFLTISAGIPNSEPIEVGHLTKNVPNLSTEKRAELEFKVIDKLAEQLAETGIQETMNLCMVANLNRAMLGELEAAVVDVVETNKKLYKME
jgi:hypothetical protein